MKELTRVHLAKVPFNIEKDAKDDLKRYLSEVQVSLNDVDTQEETMHDIELRMVEILASRGTNADGVITTADVSAMRTQLGEPEQFGDGSSKQSSQEAKYATDNPRRLMRDTDTAILGGVASGLARYFNVDPIITRLTFVAMFLASGFGIFLYIILWIVVPKAKTSADKLAMRGQPVNVDTLRAFGQEASSRLKELNAHEPARQVAKAAANLFGVLAYVAAIGILVAITVGGFALYAGGWHYRFPITSLDWLMMGFVGLIMFSVALGFMMGGSILLGKKAKSYTTGAILAVVLFVIGIAGVGSAAVLNESSMRERFDNYNNQLELRPSGSEQQPLQYNNS